MIFGKVSDLAALLQIVKTFCIKNLVKIDPT